MFYYICIYLFYICFDISVYLLEILFFLLRQCFPTIRSRDEVLTSIHVSNHLRATFEGWTPEQQEEFLDICTGVKGVKILYDAFFKEIMNPEYTPDRLSSFLSLVLRQQERTGSYSIRYIVNIRTSKFSYPANSSYNPKLFTIFLNSWQPAKDSSMTFRLSPLFSRPTQ